MAAFACAETIDCDFSVVGRFHRAHPQALYDKPEHDSQTSHPRFKTGVFMVHRDQPYAKLGTDAIGAASSFHAVPALISASITQDGIAKLLSIRFEMSWLDISSSHL
ncbi:MAG: hypothetical protein O3A63_09580, partial [Proteobacteria bacterium]|nr:hypothetical protein [Pseudomonadota bacterium]